MIGDLSRLVQAAVGDRSCVVALGGGADSAVLLAASAKALDAVRAVFVNHGLDASTDLRAAAERLAEGLGIPLTILEAVVPNGPNLEERLRDARYRAIEANLDDDEVCCTGHTRDDQAETVLMRVLRGSGPTGLSGIPASRGPFRRPFLEISRQTLRNVALASDLAFTDDPSNTDPRFLRSKIRSELIPHIESEYGPSFRSNLALSGRLIGDDADVVLQQANQIPIRTSPTEVAIPTAPLVLAPRAVATASIRTALSSFYFPHGGSHTDIEAVYATAIDGKQRSLSGDLVSIRENAELVVASKAAPDIDETVAVTVGKRFAWHGSSYNVFMSASPALHHTTGRRTALEATHKAGYVVRAAVEGDRIDIDGGSTPVSEVLRAAGVPARKRPSWPVVMADGRIAAIAGVRVAPWARPVLGQPAVIIERDHPL
ncbi:MAG: tRNA lysidine(34) synthetase TilS [Acidimicrobiia bacterium]|nr:tRNA lysidine(34) synthetase TilS [Acidimicrobiia bacterium]